MDTTEYYSAADPDIAGYNSTFFNLDIDEREFQEDAPERYEVSELSDFFNETYDDCFPDALAAEVHEFVRLVAHPYRRCFDSPAKSPKNEEIESAIRNKGKRGCCTFMRETGKFVARPITEWMFFGNNLRRKHYYTSDNRIALLYHDIDCHRDYQTQADAAAARSLIERETAAHLGVSPLFLRSERGENGYLKVDLGGAAPEEANRVFDEYQEAMRLLFAKHGIMADFEIKGTVTWIDGDGTLHAGRYGKLPMCGARWDIRWHQSLVRAKKVSLAQLQAFVTHVKATVSAEEIARLKEAKHRAFVTHYVPVGEKQKWKLIAGMGLGIYEENLVSYNRQPWMARSWIGEATVKELWPDYSCETTSAGGPFIEPVEMASDALTLAKPLPKVPADDADLSNEPDSFVRQRKALLKLARLLKSVPTVDEALTFIRDNGLYTGTWANPARRGRVRGILKHIAKTFDARKCTKQHRTPIKVNIGKYDAWAKNKFASGLVKKKKDTVDEYGSKVTVDDMVGVEWEFIAIAVAVYEFCLLTAKNDNNALPHERAKSVWNWLTEHKLVTVAFDNRKWAVCRDELEKYGIIKVTDRTKGPGQAWKWAVGTFFPFLGLWKTKKEPSLLGPISWEEFNRMLSITTERQQGQHNPLLQKQSKEMLDLSLFGAARSPPGIDTG